MKTAYIVKAYRTAVGKAPRGLFRFKRPDELAAETIEHMMKYACLNWMTNQELMMSLLEMQCQKPFSRSQHGTT